MAPVDWLILTAANAAQARGYAAQLRARSAQGELSGFRHWRVIADPGGKRVGSGGSTFHVLHQLAIELLKLRPNARSLTELFADQRIIVIHSGGDSRRLVGYAAQGKVFTPLPCRTPDDRPATLFDLIAQSLLKLPAPPGGQVLLASGDLLLTFDYNSVNFARPGVVGVAYRGPMERGSRHGVYVADADLAVADFLQKPSESVAREHHALDTAGRVLIDTGLVNLDPTTAQRWLNAAGVTLRDGAIRVGPGIMRDMTRNASPPIDLYEQVMMAMPPARTRDSYLGTVVPPSLNGNQAARERKRLAALHQALHGTPFHVEVLPWCDFFHIGSSRELLANVNTLGRTAQEHGFANHDHAVIASGASLESAFVFNSLLLDRATRLSDGVFIEACHFKRAVQLDGPNAVIGWPDNADIPLRLPPGWAITCLPMAGDDKPWAVVLHGLDDDFKTSLAKGGTFGNRPITDFLSENNLHPRTLFSMPDASNATLWDAHLWVVGGIRDALRQTLWMVGQGAGQREAWRRSKRLSLREILPRVDHDRLIDHRAEIQRLVGLAQLDTKLQRAPWLPASEVLHRIRGVSDAKDAIRGSARAARDADPLLRARLSMLDSLIARKHPRASHVTWSEHQNLAFAHVAESVARAIPAADRTRAATILHDQAVWVTSPVRLDLAGGWSDTPPICAELGGAVVNAAITLNGQYPIQVMAKLREEPVITLNSIDLGRTIRITNERELWNHDSPSDWAALPKAALVLSGLTPDPSGSPRQSLAARLKRLGGGLDLTLFSALPKGSGLGTSSILGAAVLACLAKVTGESLSNEQLIARTSLLEQFMTTGGGWQDQVGGVTPGVKLTRTTPGPDQTPSIHWTTGSLLEDGPSRELALLYYTGHRRLAKNILRNVVGRYLARDPRGVAIFHELKAGAERMKQALDARDLNAVSEGINEYWRLKCELDPGSTTDAIESLIAPLRRHLRAHLLPGAGGGGFVFMLARSRQDADAIRRHLTRRPPNPHARFFDFDLDTHGLRVTVL